MPAKTACANKSCASWPSSSAPASKTRAPASSPSTKSSLPATTDDATREITAEALEHAKGHLRSELSRRIKLFKTPELHFKYDQSLERGMSISQLIEQVAAEEPVQD